MVTDTRFTVVIVSQDFHILYELVTIFMYIVRLVARASKMKRILRSDQLPERGKWACLPRSRLSAFSRKNRLCFGWIKTQFLPMSEEVYRR